MVLKISLQMASAAAHLHSRGIMHGDLYAHNILIDPKANPLFGDFGAASLFNFKDTSKAQVLEKIEVRAFGCLVDDLLLHLGPEDQDLKGVKILSNLKDACFKNNPNERPGFRELIREIENIV